VTDIIYYPGDDGSGHSLLEKRSSGRCSNLSELGSRPALQGHLDWEFN
jgi:hypothetical protein